MMRNATGQKGFTLIELIVVIAILGVLAAITVPTVTNYLGTSKARSFSAESDRIQAAVDAFVSSPDNTRFIGRRQFPLIGRDQTDQSLVNATSTANLTDDQNPFPATSSRVWNPLGGVQGVADLSAKWVDGDSNGVRDIDASSPDAWTTVSVTRGDITYFVDVRYYFVDFEALVTSNLIDAIPITASDDNKPENSTKSYTGSYSWYVDDGGTVQSLYSFLPSKSGFQEGVFP